MLGKDGAAETEEGQLEGGAPAATQGLTSCEGMGQPQVRGCQSEDPERLSGQC